LLKNFFHLLRNKMYFKIIYRLHLVGKLSKPLKFMSILQKSQSLILDLDCLGYHSLPTLPRLQKATPSRARLLKAKPSRARLLKATPSHARLLKATPSRAKHRLLNLEPMSKVDQGLHLVVWVM
jgi:hypothetical protein